MDRLGLAVLPYRHW